MVFAGLESKVGFRAGSGLVLAGLRMSFRVGLGSFRVEGWLWVSGSVQGWFRLGLGSHSG